MSTKKSPPTTKKPRPSRAKPKTEPLAGPAEPPQIVIPEHREDIQAPYKFSPSELDGMNHGLRTALDDIETLQSQAKAAAQDFKLRITNRQNDAKQLRNKLGAGEETRPMRAAVDFDSTRGMKRFLNPESGAFIREEQMQPADWQLPLFKAEEAERKPASSEGATSAPPKKSTPKTSKPPASSPVGATSVGNAIDSAAAKTKAAQFLLDLEKGDWSAEGLTRAFKAAAKKAGWSAPQVSALNDRLKECTTLESMIETLRPFVVASEDSMVEVGGVMLPRLSMEFQPGFTTEKYVGQFRKVAKGAGWPEAAIDEVAHEAERQARVIGDEPEATQAAAKHLSGHIFLII